MGMLIVAMVVAAALVHAGEKAKHRSTQAWRNTQQRAQERAEHRRRERERRAAEWEQRLNDAHRRGPAAALWWAHAAGYVLAGAGAALGAGIAGAATGFIDGARSGHAIGREAGRQGWRYQQAWHEWRQRTSRTPLDLVQCQRCGGWITAEHLTGNVEYGRVCPDCVPTGPVPPPQDDDEPEPQEDVIHECRPGDTPPPKCANRCGLLAAAGSDLCALCQIEEINRWEREAEKRRRQAQGCDGRCRNSNLGPTEAIKRGLCPKCGDLGELITNFGGHHRHIRCPDCDGTGKSRMKSTEDTSASDAEPQEPQRIYVHAERLDVTEEPNTERGGNTMGELMPANRADLAGTGEGYADTVHTLQALSTLLNKAYEEVQNLGDQLTSNSLDNATISQINELTDVLESAAPLATSLHQHVQQRHEPVAEAVAGAGGSSNVATKSWYDDL